MVVFLKLTAEYLLVLKVMSKDHKSNSHVGNYFAFRTYLENILEVQHLNLADIG